MFRDAVVELIVIYLHLAHKVSIFNRLKLSKALS